MATPVYKGQGQTPVEQAGTTFTKNELFGYDEAQVVFAARSNVSVPIPSRGASMNSRGSGSLSQMYKMSHNVRYQGPWQYVTLRYIGSIDGAVPDAIINDSTHLQSTTLRTDDPNDPPVEVMYRTQIRTARWTSFSTPTAPAHYGVAGHELTFTPFDPSPPKGPIGLDELPPPPRQFYFGSFDYTFSLTTVLFETENFITDRFWRVTEQHQYRIHDKNEEGIGSL